MSDIGAAAPSFAPAPQPQPDADVVAPPAEIKTEPQQSKEPEPKKPLSARDSLTKAAEKVQAKAKADEKAETDPKALKTEAKVDPKAPEVKDAKTEQPRDKGRFAPKEGADGNNPDPKAADDRRGAGDRDADDYRSPPKRFSADARNAWDSLPPEHDELRKETHRAFRELEAGIEKHRPQSQRYVQVFKEFDDIATASKVDAVSTLRGYVEFDRGLNNPQTFIPTMEKILASKGVTPVQYAQAIMAAHQRQNGQQPNGAPPQQRGPSQQDIDQIVRQRVEEAIKPVTQHLTQQRQAEDEQTLSEWAADKPHFAMLRGRITQLVSDEGLSPSDAYASAVNEAQEVARNLLGDSARKEPPAKADPAADVDADEQIERASRSIKGAPSAGSAPGAKKPSPTVRAALERAMKKAL